MALVKIPLRSLHCTEGREGLGSPLLEERIAIAQLYIQVIKIVIK